MERTVPNCSIAALVAIAEQRKKDNALTINRLDDFIDELCAIFEVNRKDLVSKSRESHLVTIRQMFFFIARIKTAATLKRLGMMMGDRDHTTVIHSSKAVQDFLDTKDEIFLCYWEKLITNTKWEIIPKSVSKSVN